MNRRDADCRSHVTEVANTSKPRVAHTELYAGKQCIMLDCPYCPWPTCTDYVYSTTQAMVRCCATYIQDRDMVRVPAVVSKLFDHHGGLRWCFDFVGGQALCMQCDAMRCESGLRVEWC